MHRSGRSAALDFRDIFGGHSVMVAVRRLLGIVFTLEALIMRREWRDRFRNNNCPGFSCEGFVAAVEAIRNSDLIEDKNIISIFAIDETHIFAKTGKIFGPLSGGGVDVLLRLQDDSIWVVEETAFWVS
jgi:hypothetical protein